jgi:hypothetical protein
MDERVGREITKVTDQLHSAASRHPKGSKRAVIRPDLGDLLGPSFTSEAVANLAAAAKSHWLIFGHCGILDVGQ